MNTYRKILLFSFSSLLFLSIAFSCTRKRPNAPEPPPVALQDQTRPAGTGRAAPGGGQPAAVKLPLREAVHTDPPDPCEDGIFVYGWTDYGADWSPDGQRIAYVHQDFVPPYANWGIYVRNVDGSNKRLLVPGIYVEDPEWSPDGEWILFNYGTQVYKIKVNCDSLTQLTSVSQGRFWWPHWSPDERRIACVDRQSFSRIVVMDADGGNQVHLPYNAEYPFWVSNNVIGAAQWGGGGMYLSKFSLVDSSITPITLPVPGGDLRHTEYCPATGNIIFHRQLGPDLSLFIVDTLGQNEQRVPTFQPSDYPTWSPDGAKIIYTFVDLCDGYLWIINPDGTEKRRLFPGR